MSSPGLYSLIYVFFLIFYIIFSFVGIYHLRRFGYSGDLSRTVIVFYSVISIVIIIITVLLLTILASGA